ncbi:hypothetical protein ES703_102920 [subsurface metagenome]
MVTKRRILYLALTLACLAGLVAIYFFDVYMGIYDTVYITADDKQSSIEVYQWLRGQGSSAAGTRWGEEAKFEYEIDNRQFATYSANIKVSVWHNQEKVGDLVSQNITVAPFSKDRLKWVLDTVELEPSGAPPAFEAYKYTVIIENNQLERRILWYITHPPA